MYLEFFQLKEAPFALTPDTGYLFEHAEYRKALNVLLVALQSGEGFLKIVGEVGTGKTLLCRRLLDALGEEYVTAYLPNPLLTPRQLHRAVADELDISAPRDASLQELLSLIGKRLMEINAEGRQVVLCVDEAQAMPDDGLEALRLLSNLETEKRKLLHIVLFGQPELDERLAQSGLRQLRQRIAFGYRLQPLDAAGVASYVTHRLQVAGYRKEPLFDAGALREISRASRGIPRLVNILCHKSLLAAYGKGVRRVDARLARLAVADTEDAASGSAFARWRLPALGLGLAAGLGTLFLWLGGWYR